MRVVADENIPQAAAAFAFLGDVTLRPGRTLTREQLAQCDILFVRSVTKVNRALLEGTPVRFVATATTGTDHVDTDWLAEAGIAFDSAAGSNARSVVEYVTAALLEMGLSESPVPANALSKKTLGIIGHGRIGSQIARLAPRLGLRVLACDPPRARAGERDANGNAFLPMLELLAMSEIVTCHVPLVPDGIDRTTGLLDSKALGAMRRGALLINSSRGDIIDEAALLAAVRSGALAQPVLDVWDAEPNINAAMLAAAALSTPHIAGYSFDAKLEGTRMVAESAARFVGATCNWRPEFPSLDHAHISISTPQDAHPIYALREAVRSAYAIRADHARLREETDELSVRFDRLRRTYPIRREFAAFVVSAHEAAAELCGAFGFRVEPASR